jgi:hypothetical protein
MKNWLVLHYNTNNEVINRQLILNRTEHEANNEAMAEIGGDVDDWTMTVVKNEILMEAKRVKKQYDKQTPTGTFQLESFVETLLFD